jgi:hypothetical protein
MRNAQVAVSTPVKRNARKGHKLVLRFRGTGRGLGTRRAKVRVVGGLTVLNRHYLIGALAAALVVSLAGVASAAQFQTVKGIIKPKKLPKKKRAPISLRTIVTTGDPEAPGQVPSPATFARIDFDNAGTFHPRGVPRCSQGQLAESPNTANARSICRAALVGAGRAQVFVPAGPTHATLDAEVSAFNSVPQDGRPTMILYSYVPALSFGLPLIGVLRRSTAGKDFGLRLAVSIPPLPLGASLTLFDLTVGNGFKRGYLRANCSDRNRRLNVLARFTYENGTSLAARASQRCFVRKKRRR